MECKCKTKVNLACGIRELIDTLWNVNSNDGIGIDLGVKELIDTLWNVNRYSVTISASCLLN